MENKRPTLADPNEYALIKSIYFPLDKVSGLDIDPLEAWDRQEHKHLINQAR